MRLELGLVGTALPAGFRVPHDYPRRGLVRLLGRRALFLESVDPYPVGTALTVAFALPERRELLTVRAEVVLARRPIITCPQASPGMACCFEAPDRAGYRRVARFVVGRLRGVRDRARELARHRSAVRELLRVAHAPSSPGTVERRRVPRVEVSLPVAFRTPSEYPRPGVLLNLSVSGALLSSAPPIQAGTRLSLAFALPGVADAVHASAEVVRANGNLMGCHFEALDALQLGTLDRFVRMALRASPGDS